jgi:hypothetical protein
MREGYFVERNGICAPRERSVPGIESQAWQWMGTRLRSMKSEQDWVNALFFINQKKEDK